MEKRLEEVRKLANDNLIINYIVKDRKYKCHYTCKTCGYESLMDLYSAKKGTNCPCCCVPPRVVSEHINSIVAKEETHWMIDYFEGGYNEAKLYTPNSSKRVHFVCPLCRTKQSKSLKVASLNHRGLSCECCSQTKPLTERFMSSVLNELGVSFITQLSNLDFDWCETKRYDFYIPSLNMIIETHGGQHYKDTAYGKLEDVKANDEYKHNLAKNNGIEHYVVIDCRYSDETFIKENIINSELSKYFNLESLDWNNIIERTKSNEKQMIWDYWKQNPYKSFAEIGKELGISRTVVARAIKVGAKYGIIDYDKEIHEDKLNEERDKRALTLSAKKIQKIKVFKDGIEVGSFDSLAQLENESQDLYGTTLLHSKVSVASRNGKTYKGFTFTRI